jgi:phosphatidylethanolamine-binding protein (PEBP) family uncharacterized protein
MSDPDAKPCGCFHWVTCNCSETEVESLRSQLSERERERDEARAVLRELEWFGFGFCPACNGEKPQGHFPKCSLAACLPARGSEEG